MGDVVESKTEQENLGTEAEKAAQEMTPKQATETNLKNGQDKADQEAGKQEKKFRESIKEIFEKSFGPILKIVIEGYANAFNKILEGKNTTIDRATQHELKRIENNYKTKIESAQTTEEKIKLTTEKYQEMLKKMLTQENISIKVLLQTKENENRELKKLNPQTQDFDITKTIEELQTLKGEKFSEPDVEMGKIAFESKNEDEILKKLQNSDLFKEYVQDGWDKFEFGFTATTEELDFETSKAAFEKQKAYLKALNRECGNGQKVQKMDIQQKLQNLDFDIKFCDQFNGETDISEEDFEAAKTAILKGIDDKKIKNQFEHRCKKLRKIFCKTEDDNQANDDNGSEKGTNNNDNQPSITPTQPEAATEGENQKDKDTQPEGNSTSTQVQNTDSDNGSNKNGDIPAQNDNKVKESDENISLYANELKYLNDMITKKPGLGDKQNLRQILTTPNFLQKLKKFKEIEDKALTYLNNITNSQTVNLKTLSDIEGYKRKIRNSLFDIQRDLGFRFSIDNPRELQGLTSFYGKYKKIKTEVAERLPTDEKKIYETLESIKTGKFKEPGTTIEDFENFITFKENFHNLPKEYKKQYNRKQIEKELLNGEKTIYNKIIGIFETKTKGGQLEHEGNINKYITVLKKLIPDEKNPIKVNINFHEGILQNNENGKLFAIKMMDIEINDKKFNIATNQLKPLGEDNGQRQNAETLITENNNGKSYVNYTLQE